MAKKLGVLGGMGPFATSVFLERVIENTQADRDQDHIDMVVLNHASLPDRTNAILQQHENEFLSAIKSDIELLEYSAVSNIAIPCNTSHYFYQDMQEMTDINIINMVTSTVGRVYSQYGIGSKVAVLATDGTIQSKVYEKELMKRNLKMHDLDPYIQKEIMEIIYSVKSNSGYTTNKLDSIIFDLIHHHGCACVILACTELSCLKINDELMPYCIDALNVLVEKSIKLSGKKLTKAIVTS